MGSDWIGGLFLDAAQHLLYVDIADRANLTVINTSTNQVMGILPTSGPVFAGAVVPYTHSLYLVENSSTLFQLNTTTGGLIAKLPLGHGPPGYYSLGPYSLQYFPTLRQLFAWAGYGEAIWVTTIVTFIDPSSLLPLGSLALNGTAPEGSGLAALDNSTGRLFLPGSSVEGPPLSMFVLDARNRSFVGRGHMSDFLDWTNDMMATFDPSNGDVYVMDHDYGIFVVNGSTSWIAGYVPIFNPFSCSICSICTPCATTITILSGDLAYVPSQGDLYAWDSLTSLLYIISPGIVTFNERGLSLGTNWSVTLGGVTEHSETNYTTFIEPKGTFSFSVPKVAGETPDPLSGIVQERGSSLWINITYKNATQAGQSWGPFFQGWEWAPVGGAVAGLTLAVILLTRRRRARREESFADLISSLVPYESPGRGPDRRGASRRASR